MKLVPGNMYLDKGSAVEFSRMSPNGEYAIVHPSGEPDMQSCYGVKPSTLKLKPCSEKVTVVIPHGMIPDEDLRAQLIEVGIRLIAEKCGDDDNFPEKYGAKFDNNVFSMHPYCWCEKEDCKYCRDYDPAPNFAYHGGLKVHWYKYIGRSMEIEGDVSAEKMLDIIRECLESIS